MGMRTGEAGVGSEGYVGLAVHLGARVAAAARGGQILVTRTTARLALAEPSDASGR
jgi:class 3 adenylate cyclase